MGARDVIRVDVVVDRHELTDFLAAREREGWRTVSVAPDLLKTLPTDDPTVQLVEPLCFTVVMRLGWWRSRAHKRASRR